MGSMTAKPTPPSAVDSPVEKEQTRTTQTPLPQQQANNLSLQRIDEAAPPIQFATTHYLHSIPREMRLSAEAAMNETAMYLDPLLQKRQYVFEFNPSIVILPENQKTLPEAVYLACYRVSTYHGCFHQVREGRHRNYIGIALLDAQLQILQETTIDPAGKLGRFEDFRLFVLHNELYLTSFDWLRRFWIIAPPTLATVAVIPSLTPSNWTITVEIFSRCSRDEHLRNHAKNLVYFTPPLSSPATLSSVFNESSSSSNITNVIIMEPYPMATKEIISEVSCDDRNESIVMQTIELTRERPSPTFRTTDQDYLEKSPGMRQPVLTEDRGNYCCASLKHQGDVYLLGVSHVKTPYFNRPAPLNPNMNQYFSRFYAMESVPPYNVVAQTGKFCFGHHFDTNHLTNELPVPHYANLTTWRRMTLNNQTYDCPGIHFVSGMTDDAMDPNNKLIIGYGVNDCFARLVVVLKSDVARMLFGSP